MTRTRYKHDFLPDDDEANIHGYWVPTPKEIAEACSAIRAGLRVVPRKFYKRDRDRVFPNWHQGVEYE